jgi:hypothetical protein
VGKTIFYNAMESYASFFKKIPALARVFWDSNIENLLGGMRIAPRLTNPDPGEGSRIRRQSPRVAARFSSTVLIKEVMPIKVER